MTPMDHVGTATEQPTRQIRAAPFMVSASALFVLAGVVATGIKDSRSSDHEKASCANTVAGVDDSECQFLAQNKGLMEKMMQGMGVAPSGAVDADFARLMIPHHQGAIDMALLELNYGRNEQLRRIAQEIIVDQRQEIDAMQLALGARP